MIPYETPWPNDLSGKGRHRAWKWVSLLLRFPDKPCWLAHLFCWGIRCFSSIVLQFTAAGSYIALNNMQTTSIEYGHDTPHHDLSDIRNKCTLITCLPFRILLHNRVSRLTYFNIWCGCPPWRRTNRPTWQVPGSQTVKQISDTNACFDKFATIKRKTTVALMHNSWNWRPCCNIQHPSG